MIKVWNGVGSGDEKEETAWRDPVESSGPPCFRSIRVVASLTSLRHQELREQWWVVLLPLTRCDHWKAPSDWLIVSFVLTLCPASPSWAEHLYNPPTSSQNSLFILHPLKLVRRGSVLIYCTYHGSQVSCALKLMEFCSDSLKIHSDIWFPTPDL